MNLGLWISRRLRLRTGGSSATGVVIAVTGVALALMVMELTLAVVTGFKNEIRRKLMAFDALVSVYGPYDYDSGITSTAFTVDDDIRRAIDEGIQAVPDLSVPVYTSASVRQAGIIKPDAADDFRALMFVGREPDGDFGFERENIVEGTFPDYADPENTNSIVISISTAAQLVLTVGDKVYSTFFIPDPHGGDGRIKTRRHTIAGLYDSNFGEYDNTVVYASIEALRRVADLDSLSATEIDLRIPYDHSSAPPSEETIDRLAQSIQTSIVDAAARGLSQVHPVSALTSSGAQYFSWLSLLDTNVIVILILMICVTGFTLISSLFILILERVSTIGILRALGADKAMVRRIFVSMALRLVGAGMIIGNILGIGIILTQRATGFLPLDPEMYYLSTVPMEFSLTDILTLNIGTVFVGWLILILPSRLASGVDPAKTMRYQ